MVHGFIDPWRAIGGGCAKDGELSLNVIDFGPARNEPLGGTPAEIFAEWRERLGLECTASGEVIPRSVATDRSFGWTTRLCL